MAKNQMTSMKEPELVDGRPGIVQLAENNHSLTIEINSQVCDIQEILAGPQPANTSMATAMDELNSVAGTLRKTNNVLQDAVTMLMLKEIKESLLR
jgi:hypothetical protein